MKSKEKIINDSIKLETPPGDYNLLEIHCFLALKQLLVMFHNKQITTENASKTKQLILADYEKRCKEYEFQTSMFQEHIDHIKNTEAQRIRLNKMLNGKDEELKKIPFEEGLCQSLNLAVEILDTVFKGEFTKQETKQDNEMNEMLKNMIPFMKAAQEAIKEPNKQYEFECPICKGQAVAGKASINGHIHAHCNKCKIQIMQ